MAITFARPAWQHGQRFGRPITRNSKSVRRYVFALSIDLLSSDDTSNNGLVLTDSASASSLLNYLSDLVEDGFNEHQFFASAPQLVEMLINVVGAQNVCRCPFVWLEILQFRSFMLLTKFGYT